jgi:uncharacterized membrane-anchored protein YhcB (DUF1043 family)
MISWGGLVIGILVLTVLISGSISRYRQEQKLRRTVIELKKELEVAKAKLEEKYDS